MQSNSTINQSNNNDNSTNDSNIELTELEICLAKCTNPLTRLSNELIDELCSVTNSQTNGPYTTLKFLAYKAQSPQESEALHALSVLELLIERGGFRIADELGKFRFLNEIIKIVSPKCLAHQTTPKVGQRIIELLFQWSMEFKELPKIFEAYQMLKVQKIVVDDPVHVLKNYRPPTPPKPRPKHEIFDNEETVKTLRSLIESGGTENLEAANQMIKNLALKAESHDQFKLNFATEIESARNCAHLLNDMVTQSNSNLKIDTETKRVIYRGTTEEDLQLMRELLTNCETIRFRLYRYSNQITENDQDELRQLIEISDILLSTINSCKRYFILLDDPQLLRISTNSSENNVDNKNQTNPLEEEILLDLNATPLTSPKRITIGNMAALDYHSNNTNEPTNSILRDLVITNETIASATITNDDDQMKIDSCTKALSSSSLSKSVEISESDLNLKQLTEMFNQHNLSNNQDRNHMNEKIFPNIKSIKINEKIDDNHDHNNIDKNKNDINDKEYEDLSELLSNINQICYENIHPCREMRPPLLVFNDDGLVVNLHFTGNKPHQQVSVFLLTFTNYNRSNITDIHFWAAVPKRMKVKLQYQTGSTLPGLKNGQDFPEKFISQVMLIAFDRNYLNEKNESNLKQSKSEEHNSSLIKINEKIDQIDNGNDDHDYQSINNYDKKSIQYKLKYKLTFKIDEKYFERVSQLIWSQNF